MKKTNKALPILIGIFLLFVTGCAQPLNEHFGFKAPKTSKICEINYETYYGGIYVPSLKVKSGTVLRQNQLPEIRTEGRRFLGWYYGEDRIEPGFTVESDITLIARWELIEYTITYILDGGTQNKDNPSSYNIETPTFSLFMPYKEGYSFIGWYPENRPTYPLWTIFSGSTGDLVLYAKWEKNVTYQVFYVSDHGHVPASIDVFWGTMLFEENLPALEESGWIFNGWYLDDNYTEEVLPGYIVEHPIVLYAKWEKAPVVSIERDLEMVHVISESTKIIGDQPEGVFIEGRTVILSPYYIGKYEVTQRLYEEVMGVNPSKFCSDPSEGEVQELRPVDRINWYRAIVFCNKLSIKEGYEPCYSIKDSHGNEIDWENLMHHLIPLAPEYSWSHPTCDMTKNGYRLPTETEWEFAARGGDQKVADWNYMYPGSDTLSDVAWYLSTSDRITHEVGKKNANRLGIFDMSGNLEEWCYDNYDMTRSNSGTVIDPDDTQYHLDRGKTVRGSNYLNPKEYCSVVQRSESRPDHAYSSYGFRLARSADNWKEEHDKAVAAGYVD